MLRSARRRPAGTSVPCGHHHKLLTFNHALKMVTFKRAVTSGSSFAPAALKLPGELGITETSTGPTSPSRRAWRCCWGEARRLPGGQENRSPSLEAPAFWGPAAEAQAAPPPPAFAGGPAKTPSFQPCHSGPAEDTDLHRGQHPTAEQGHSGWDGEFKEQKNKTAKQQPRKPRLEVS